MEHQNQAQTQTQAQTKTQHEYHTKHQTQAQTQHPTYHPLKNQVGGKHYQLTIQPIEYTNKNKLNFNQGNIIKYITRHKEKNGVEDIKKVIHYTLIEAFYSYPPDQFEDVVNWLRKEIGIKGNEM